MCGTVGPILLSIYFATPTFTDWPLASATPERIAAYAVAHERLFFAGAWLQGTGALASALFFVLLTELSAPDAPLLRMVTVVAAALLLAIVLVEGAFLSAVPMAAANNDIATVAAAFALSNGVFVRVFPIVPAPLLFAVAGAALSQGALLPRLFRTSAWVLAALFELAGIAAIFSHRGFIAAIILAVGQQFWILAAALTLVVAQPNPLTVVATGNTCPVRSNAR